MQTPEGLADGCQDVVGSEDWVKIQVKPCPTASESYSRHWEGIAKGRGVNRAWDSSGHMGSASICGKLVSW